MRIYSASRLARLLPAGPGRFHRSLTRLVGLALLVVLLASRTGAAAFLVTNLNDSGIGSLRQAVALAAPGDVITFSPALDGFSTTIALTSGAIAIDKDLTLQGRGARRLRVSGSGISRIFVVGQVNPACTVNISGLTLMSGANLGAPTSATPGYGSTAFGGAILNGGALNLTACQLSFNWAIGGGGTTHGGGGFGGAIENRGSLTVRDCTFDRNTVDPGASPEGTSSAGGAINNDPPGTLAAYNSTFSLNSVFPRNRGTAVGGAINSYSDPAGPNCLLVNCTISGNVAAFGDGGATSWGGGVAGGTFALRNTLIAGNFSPRVIPDVAAVVVSEGNNLIGVTDGAINPDISPYVWLPSDLTGSTAAPLDPLLGTLFPNGSHLDTMALLPGSPAIDAADAGAAPPADERGFARGSLPDIGAFEADGVSPVPPVSPEATLRFVLGQPVIRVSWQPSTQAPRGYEIERRTGDGAYQSLGFFTALSYDDAAVALNTTYGYRVRVFDDDYLAYSEWSAEASVTVAVNAAPAAAADSYAADEDQPLSVPAPGVLENDTDANGDPLTAVLETPQTHGTLTLNPDGSFSYLPEPDYHGSDSFSYRASDGQASSAPVTVTLTVNPVQDPPEPLPDNASTGKNTPVTIAVLENDSDPDGDPLAVQSVTQPEHGAVVANPDGTVTYTPRAKFTGTDSFTYRVSDGQGNTAAAAVTVGVSAPNRPPRARRDLVETPRGTAVVVPVLANDSDPDGDPLTLTAVTQPKRGSVVMNGDGTVTYMPPPKFQGTIRFTYSISDGRGGTDTARCRVTVH